jgi:uncharacterized protein (DUF433 family)
MRNSARIDKARALVVEDPEILSGTPVIRNTRIPVYDVAASVAAGLPMDRILEDYPGLTGEMVELAALYATLNPPKDRPRDHSSPPAALIISRRRIPRRNRTRPKGENQRGEIGNHLFLGRDQLVVVAEFFRLARNPGNRFASRLFPLLFVIEEVL